MKAEIPLCLRRGIRLREHERVLGDRRVGDPVLLPVQDVAAAVPPGVRQHGCDVRAGGRLGQPEARELLPARLRNEIAPLLLFARVAEEAQRVEPDVDRDERPKGGLATLDLLAREGLRDEVHAGAAVLLGNDDPQQPELGHAFDHGHVQVVVDVVLDRVREHAFVHELADGRLHLALLGRELEIHGTSLRVGEAESSLQPQPRRWFSALLVRKGFARPCSWALAAAAALPAHAGAAANRDRPFGSARHPAFVRVVVELYAAAGSGAIKRSPWIPIHSADARSIEVSKPGIDTDAAPESGFGVEARIDQYAGRIVLRLHSGASSLQVPRATRSVFVSNPSRRRALEGEAPERRCGVSRPRPQAPLRLPQHRDRSRSIAGRAAAEGRERRLFEHSFVLDASQPAR